MARRHSKQVNPSRLRKAPTAGVITPSDRCFDFAPLVSGGDTHPPQTRFPEISGAALDAFALSPREREIAGWVAAGATNKEIGYALAISHQTVKNILTKIFAKTGLRSRTELAVSLVKDRNKAPPSREICVFSGSRCLYAAATYRSVRSSRSKTNRRAK